MLAARRGQRAVVRLLIERCFVNLNPRVKVDRRFSCARNRMDTKLWFLEREISLLPALSSSTNLSDNWFGGTSISAAL